MALELHHQQPHSLQKEQTMTSPPSRTVDCSGYVVDRTTMAATRERLEDASDKLRLAFSDLRVIDDEVTALTAGVGDRPLSEAAARVSQGASAAATVASRILQAAEVAEVAAGKAAAAVTAARGARAEAEQADAAAVAEAVHKATQNAKTMGIAAAALEVKVQPPIPFDSVYVADSAAESGYCNAFRDVS